MESPFYIGPTGRIPHFAVHLGLCLFFSPLILIVSGCGGSPEPNVVAPQAKVDATPKPRTGSRRPSPPLQSTASAAGRPAERAAAPDRKRRTSLADLLEEAEAENRGKRDASFSPTPLREIDESRAAAAGIRKIEGRHLTLFTDLPPQPAVDELPRVFDQAVPQWCAYVGVDPADASHWRIRGFLMDRKERFSATDLLPDDLPPFLNGFHRGYEIWVYEQPSDYYRRHLLLHEGTHAFMNILLGGAGPPWYMEGMAEILATHRWRDGTLTVNYFPQSKDETPMWGRIKIVQDEFASSRGRTLPQVFELGPQAHLKVEPYGWSWAAAAFLDGHPRTRSAFRSLRDDVALDEPEFSMQLRKALGEGWLHALEEWQLFVANIDYGYDLAREAVEYRPGSPPPPGGQTANIASGRGWQSSGVRVEVGRTYRITATGRYTVAQSPQPWWCEPNGVTIRYRDGLPLGALLGAVRPDDFAQGDVAAFLNPGPVGTERTIRAPATGVLYFRINDFPAELADNEGTLTVRVEPAP